MTNQSVVVSDCASGINVVAMTVALANSSLFAPVAAALPKPSFGGGGGYITMSRTNSLKNIEINNGERAKRVHAWVESMRASSPTRKSSLSQSADDYKTWTLQHPSALAMFEEITEASKGKQIVVFLDYDGTLSPIVEDPEKAFMTTEMREAVRDVAKYFPTAIVSGRCRAKVHNFVKLSELFYAGSHGMDIKGPANSDNHKNGNQGILFQPAKEFVPMMNNVYKILLERTKIIPGAKVENNKFCLSVHFRRVDEKLWVDLAEKVKSVLKEYPKLRLTQGRKVLEIRPTIKWDKGKALEFLLESLGYGNSDDVLPVYIGDDRTDEDAFKVLHKRGQGLGILVSKFPKETAASYSLEEPLQVMQFLQRLVEWKRSMAT
ncbi:putative trehalose-phosphate phosphatase D [Apium graveolens]|uniref:putative trehalose-phosphate phosphatase D n=1 Tax=Apium graveolens TaxID=4045 RepID=UPI003D79CC7A